MKIKKLHNLVLVIAIILVASMVTGTLAYITQELTTENEYQLKKYSTEITEEFDPPTEWKPGENVNKDVSITNSGEVPVFVKVVINQKWVRSENVYDNDGKAIAPLKGESFPLSFQGTDGAEYAALIHWGNDVVKMAKTADASSDDDSAPALDTQDTNPDGDLLKYVPGDDIIFLTDSADPSLSGTTVPVEISNMQAAEGKWIMMNDTPDADGNMTFYYIGVLGGKSATPLLVDSVRMNPAIESAITETKTVWDPDTRTWITTTTTKPEVDYMSARYTMTVNMYTVQATEAAIAEMFQSDVASEQAVISYMESLADKNLDYSRDDSVKQKLLYIDEQNGKLSYTPATGTTNWFMSHLNMLPGESYTDTLNIENRSNKTAEIFLQIIPRNQAELPDELLDYIKMKVYEGNVLIYDGTAKGGQSSVQLNNSGSLTSSTTGSGDTFTAPAAGTVNNPQNAVSLGRFAPSSKKDIKVELTLDKDIPMEYGGTLSMIDWKFMIQEDKTTPTPTPTPGGKVVPSPKTGDFLDAVTYKNLMMIGILALAGCIVFLIATRKYKKQ